MKRHADLAGQKNVLARLRHRAVGGRHHQDRAVHLGRARDHVLHVVGMARAVDMGVVALLGLVFHVAVAIVRIFVMPRGPVSPAPCRSGHTP